MTLDYKCMKRKYRKMSLRPWANQSSEHKEESPRYKGNKRYIGLQKLPYDTLLQTKLKNGKTFTFYITKMLVQCINNLL